MTDQAGARLRPALRPVERATPLVGREPELGVLCERLDAAAGGAGGVTLLCGEPGIGKTRLLAEAARLARQRGFTVVTGNCYRAEGALPYRPWIEVLNGLAADPDEKAFGRLRPAAAADLARLVPELSEGPSEGAVAPGDQLRLFDTVASVLLTAARKKPVALLLEDLHWADASSSRLLGHLSRRIGPARLAVIATYRETDIGPGHPFREVLAEFSERRTALRIDVSGLSQDEVLAMVSHFTGQPAVSISSSFIWGLLTATDGNPYFIEEVLRHLEASGKVFDADGRLLGDGDPFTRMTVPRDLRHAIAQRIERLGPETVDVLRAAAVLGRQFEFETLREMTGLPSAPLLKSLEEGIAARLVIDVREESGRFDFDHALVQRALAENVATPRRQQMHLGAALATEKLHGDDPGRWAAAIAFHYREAKDPAHVEKVALFGKLALESAERAYAWDAFMWQFDATLRSLEELAAPALVEARFVCDVVAPRFNLATLAPDRLRFLARRAGDLLFAGGDRERAALMRQVEGYTYQSSAFRHLQDLQQALRLFEEAESIAADAEFRATITAMKPNALFQMGRCEEADAIARDMTTSHFRARRMWGLAYHGHYATHLGHIAEGLRSFRSAVEEAGQSVSAIAASSTALQWQSICCLFWLRAPALVEPLHRLELDRSREDVWQKRVSQISVLAARRERGLRSAVRAQDYLGSSGDQAEFEVAAWLFYEGEWDVALETMLRLQQATTDSSALHLLASAAYGAGEMHRAAGLLLQAEPLLNRSFLTSIPIDNVAGHASLGLLCAEVGRRAEARDHARACREAMTDDDWLGLGARVDLIEALVKLHGGDPDGAETSFATALRTMRRVEHPWDEAEAHRLFGKVLLDLWSREAAAAHFTEALRIYARIGAARPFIDRVTALWPEGNADSTVGAAAVSAAAPGGLSAREAEVLGLLARGLSNRRIGEELVLSEATVKTHVRHILEKTGTANRTEATAWALRNLPG